MELILSMGYWFGMCLLGAAMVTVISVLVMIVSIFITTYINLRFNDNEKEEDNGL